MNYWKQLPHVMKYFRADEDPSSKVPNNFMKGFLEASLQATKYTLCLTKHRAGTEQAHSDGVKRDCT